MKIIRPILAVLLLASAAEAAPTQITLLHVKDTHSHLRRTGPRICA